MFHRYDPHMTPPPPPVPGTIPKIGGAEMTTILSDNNSRILTAPQSDPLEGAKGVIGQNYCHCISWEKSDDNKNATFQNAVFPVLLADNKISRWVPS